MTKYNALDISSYIINYSNEIGSPINNLKLQKLLYYSQAAMLVETGNKCFESPIVAWKFGPVVPEVYQRYKEYGRDDIPNQEENQTMKFDEATMKIVYKPAEKISLLMQSIIGNVVKAYEKVQNPFELVRKTHEEDPWKNTDLNQEISCEEIRKYYTKHPKRIYGV